MKYSLNMANSFQSLDSSLEDLIAGYEGEFATEDTLLTALQDVEKLGDMDMDLMTVDDYALEEPGDYVSNPKPSPHPQTHPLKVVDSSSTLVKGVPNTQGFPKPMDS